MATAPQALFMNEAQRQSRRRLEQLHARTALTAGAANAARRENQRSQSALQALEANPPAAAVAAPGHRTMALLTPIFLLGTCLGEWVVSVPTAEWLTVAVIGRPDWLPWTRVALPLGIILADLMASYLRYRAQDEALFDDGFDARQSLAWLMLGAMVMLSLATQLAVQPQPDAPRQLVQSFWTKAAGLVMITAVLHGLILLNGRLIVESLSYWAFLMQRTRFRHTAARAEGDHAQGAQATVVFFSRYIRERQEHIQRFGHIDADVFDEVTRGVLRDRLGYDPIQGPQPNTARTDDSRPEPPVAPPPRANDDDYYRKIVEERLRNEESEVRN